MGEVIDILELRQANPRTRLEEIHNERLALLELRSDPNCSVAELAVYYRALAHLRMEGRRLTQSLHPAGRGR